MSRVPRSVQRLGISLSILLLLGIAAYADFLITGNYVLLIRFFRNAGALYFLCIAALATRFAYRVRAQFDFTEPMRLTWTMIFLSFCFQFAGYVFAQMLGMELVWNPLVILGHFQAEQARKLYDLGLVLGSPVAMAFLAAGLSRVLVLKHRLQLTGSLTATDRVLIAVILLFTATQFGEMGKMLSHNRNAVTVSQLFLWFTDPLLAVLLAQAMSIRRLVINLGDGLVARCWWMMAAGVLLTSAGNAFLWAQNYGMISEIFVPLGWFIWFLPATAYACAPCFQLEAMRQAHEGSYSSDFRWEGA